MDAFLVCSDAQQITNTLMIRVALTEMRCSGEISRIFESYGLEAPIQQEWLRKTSV